MLIRGKNLGRKVLNRFLYGFVFASIASLASTSLFSKLYSTEKPLVATAFAEVPSTFDSDGGDCDGGDPGNTDCGDP